MCSEYNVSMGQLKQAIKAESDAKEFNSKGYILSGNVKIFSDGTVNKAYSRAGELMVQCIEDAYKELNCPVHITGEYLMATPDEGWAGSH